MIDEVGNPELRKIEFHNYNELTGSFKQKDLSNLQNALSSSVNIKVDYNDFKNHVHFGSAVTKIENFKSKISNIEDSLTIISQSLVTGSLDSVDEIRTSRFNEINRIKATFTDFEKALYYKSDTLDYTYKVNLGPDYSKSIPVVQSRYET